MSSRKGSLKQANLEEADDKEVDEVQADVLPETRNQSDITTCVVAHEGYIAVDKIAKNLKVIPSAGSLSTLPSACTSELLSDGILLL
jgi:hypothetical protein